MGLQPRNSWPITDRVRDGIGYGSSYGPCILHESFMNDLLSFRVTRVKRLLLYSSKSLDGSCVGFTTLSAKLYSREPDSVIKSTRRTEEIFVLHRVYRLPVTLRQRPKCQSDPEVRTDPVINQRVKGARRMGERRTKEKHFTLLGRVANISTCYVTHRGLSEEYVRSTLTTSLSYLFPFSTTLPPPLSLSVPFIPTLGVTRNERSTRHPTFLPKNQFSSFGSVENTSSPWRVPFKYSVVILLPTLVDRSFPDTSMVPWSFTYLGVL